MPGGLLVLGPSGALALGGSTLGPQASAAAASVSSGLMIGAGGWAGPGARLPPCSGASGGGSMHGPSSGGGKRACMRHSSPRMHAEGAARAAVVCRASRYFAASRARSRRRSRRGVGDDGGFGDEGMGFGDEGLGFSSSAADGLDGTWVLSAGGGGGGSGTGGGGFGGSGRGGGNGWEGWRFGEPGEGDASSSGGGWSRHLGALQAQFERTVYEAAWLWVVLSMGSMAQVAHFVCSVALARSEESLAKEAPAAHTGAADALAAAAGEILVGGEALAAVAAAAEAVAADAEGAERAYGDLETTVGQAFEAAEEAAA